MRRNNKKNNTFYEYEIEKQDKELFFEKLELYKTEL